MKTDTELVRHIGRCIESAANNWEQHYPPTNGTIKGALLFDLESDLDEALRSVRELYRRQVAAASARYGKA